ncbi:type II toxin-antitoxin system RelE/ParE family toxin [Flavivirga jejuensis]|uniref:Type II toxin-antitoxin system RelE/ParE family toxin n=1 Tax=Flavivirga jejuensis TaxID=870487 RepID=A0ABT8WUZ0_9FLAO|nr:type II toxin-antitoxin system RelE/ParE family toxin [Flavivirga jejuensis]MDO5976904.1 type II toxin-antitoxin system RelE/ParE family toxin [Flavivirga jejuensis]
MSLRRSKLKDKYILSRKTQEDIDELFDYGIHHFGNDKTLDYLLGLRTYFKSIQENPEIGKKRNEIKKDLLSFPYNSHIIFYRVFF